MPVSALSIKTIISMKDKRTILSSVLCAVALAFGSTAYATTLTIGDSRDLGSNSYLYILGKYDGPNYGSEVWYGAGLSGVITLPEFGNGKKYGLSHVFVFNGTPVTTPDGGTTAALLGLALTGLAGLRAKFGRH